MARLVGVPVGLLRLAQERGPIVQVGFVALDTFGPLVLEGRHFLELRVPIRLKPHVVHAEAHSLHRLANRPVRLANVPHRCHLASEQRDVHAAWPGQPVFAHVSAIDAVEMYELPGSSSSTKM